MQKYLHILLAVFVQSTTSAQTIKFDLAPQQPALPAIYGGSIAFGDIDGDGDQDCLQLGQNPIVTILLENNGEGVFTEVTGTPFPNMFNGNVRFNDLDKDGDLDVVMSGSRSGLATMKVFLNDGNGEFQEKTNLAIPGILGGDLEFGDLDDDGDDDLLISGIGPSDVLLAQLFLNDGAGNFSEVAATPFVALANSEVILFDQDGDGNSDVLISGTNPAGQNAIDLYLNEGSGVFVKVNSSFFTPLASGGIDAADSDNDGDIDICITGLNGSNVPETNLYLNDGNGSFSLLSSTPFTGSFAGVVRFADFDNDDDNDLLIIGSEQGGIPNIWNVLYQNQGDNNFIPADTLGGEYLAAAAIGDLDGDGLKDVMIHGFVEGVKLYFNKSITTSTIFGNDEGRQGMRIYPNPTDGDISIDFADSSLRDGTLTILDTQGRIVFKEIISPSPAFRTRLTLNQGIYFTSFQNPQVQLNSVLLIQR